MILHNPLRDVINMPQSHGTFPALRLRRLRQSAVLRNLVREHTLSPSKFVMPIFIKEGTGIRQPIQSMPGIYQFSLDHLSSEIDDIVSSGVRSILLFGIPQQKDATGSISYHDHGVIQTAVPMIKKIAPELLVIADVCLCEYTDHGHCGVVLPVRESHREVCVDNDQTLALLTKQAVSLAKAGCDVIAPSGCMDGVVAALRLALDQAAFHHIPILSYAVKYASSFYGPFREAAEGAPQFGDRRTYQVDYANTNEALHECALDVAEGTDMLMVKPAHTYLDVIYRIKQAYPHLPLAAYHVSGEYAMLKAAALAGWLEEKKAVLEAFTAIHRAGADVIISYYAKTVARWLQES